MKSLNYKDNFDVILLLFSAFGYFSDEENLLLLKNISKALKNKGMFCFDIFNRDSFLKDFKEFNVLEKENNLMIDRCSFDPMTGVYSNKRIVIRNGIRKDKPFFIRLYNFNEIKFLLEKANLSIYRVFGNWDSGKFNSESKRMIVIAQKN
ncbi:MAG: hypothetical protein U0457_17900 [Candidatus Sericytochromatia bacterium]